MRKQRDELDALTEGRWEYLHQSMENEVMLHGPEHKPPDTVGGGVLRQGMAVNGFFIRWASSAPPGPRMKAAQALTFWVVVGTVVALALWMVIS